MLERFEQEFDANEVAVMFAAMKHYRQGLVMMNDPDLKKQIEILDRLIEEAREAV